MKKKVIIYALLILTVVNLAALGTFLFHRFRSCARTRAEHVPAEGFEQIKQELSLSAEQVVKFQGFRKAFHSELDSLTAQQNGLRRQLIQELGSATPSRERLSEINGRINRLQIEAQERVIDHLLDVKAILNPEQQTKFLSIMLQRLTSSTGPGKYLRGD
jgi:septal ring factor EnvC (AmiA/AmiB activator)